MGERSPEKDNGIVKALKERDEWKEAYAISVKEVHWGILYEQAVRPRKYSRGHNETICANSSDVADCNGANQLFWATAKKCRTTYLLHEVIILQFYTVIAVHLT